MDGGREGGREGGKEGGKEGGRLGDSTKAPTFALFRLEMREVMELITVEKEIRETKATTTE